MIGIVVSKADTASVTIGDQLLEIGDWTEHEAGVYRQEGFELREFDEWHLELDHVAEAFDDPSCIVVVSRHSGETGPLLSAHFTGNFGAAEYGGEPQELVDPAPGALKRLIRALDDRAPDQYAVSMECTHHGPSELGAPGLFVELGSGPDQWKDTDGGRAIAESVLALDGVSPDSDRTLVAFGGNHYAPQPTRILLETDAAVGHVAADWSIEELDDPETNRDVVEAMFEKSGTDRALVDGEWPGVSAVVESLGYDIVSETWVRETSGVDPALVADLETRLGSIESGLRFGDCEADSVLERALPSELVQACAAIDPDQTVDTVATHTVAYQTEENGNRVGAAAAFASQNGYDELIDALASILETDYDTVERTDDAVIAERTEFDPKLAAAVGVPEGPLFGQLAGGESVTVKGETIDPASVHSRETRRFDV